MQATKHGERTLKATHTPTKMGQGSHTKEEATEYQRDRAKDWAPDAREEATEYQGNRAREWTPDAKEDATEAQSGGHAIPANNAQRGGEEQP